MEYPVKLERDDNDTILVSFPDFPEAHTHGDDVEDALNHAPEALATAIDAYIKDRRDIPLPSAIVATHRVMVPALIEAKIRLYEAMREAKVGKSELAKRLDWHLLQVDRLLAMTHGSKLDQLESAFRAMGKRLVIGVEDVSAIGHRRKPSARRRRQSPVRVARRASEAAARDENQLCVEASIVVDGRSRVGRFKPKSFVGHGSRGLLQPAIRCRGREYLRIIYGPEYTLPENLNRLREPGLSTNCGVFSRAWIRTTGNRCRTSDLACGRSESKSRVRIASSISRRSLMRFMYFMRFAKKTRKTARLDLEIGRERFRALIAMRTQQHGKEKRRKVTPSSGNVFRDLGFSREEAEHHVIRADLLIQLQKLIASRSLKQSEVARLLRVSQPRVSDLLRGRIDLFSTDSLIDMLARFGVSVRLVVKASRSRKVA